MYIVLTNTEIVLILRCTIVLTTAEIVLSTTEIYGDVLCSEGAHIEMSFLITIADKSLY